MRMRTLLAATVAVPIVLLSAPASRADLPVVDASNLVQNVLQAARTLQEINNQVIQIQQFVQMLENEARNLASLPLSTLQSLTSSISSIQQLMSQAQGLVYDVSRLTQQFQQLYPQQYAATTTSGQIFQDAHTRWLNALQALQTSLQVQSRIVTDIPLDQENLSQALTASQGAVGILQATQAGNQLMALQAKQIAALQALLAAHARADELSIARQTADEEAARVQRDQFFGDGVHYTPQPVQFFR